MPTELRLPITRKEIESIILRWIDFLASDNYIEAYNLTSHDPYYGWSPDLLKNIIQEYGSPSEGEGIRCKVSDWRTALPVSSSRYRDINVFEEPIIQEGSSTVVLGEVHYDLPIDTQWSDLTATFKIRQDRDKVTLELNDIHVL